MEASFAGVSISFSLARFATCWSTNFTSATEVLRSVLGMTLDRLKKLVYRRRNSGVGAARAYLVRQKRNEATAVERSARGVCGTVLADANGWGKGEVRTTPGNDRPRRRFERKSGVVCRENLCGA